MLQIMEIFFPYSNFSPSSFLFLFWENSGTTEKISLPVAHSGDFILPHLCKAKSPKRVLAALGEKQCSSSTSLELYG